MRTESSQLAAATRLFSPGIITKLAKAGDFREFAALCQAVGLLEAERRNFTVGDAFDAAFDVLKLRGARSEYVYKAALTHNILLGVHSLSTASMVSEFRAVSSKADVVIFNGTSTVYEIKSERDNLGRLAGQIDDYRNVFARVFVICAPIHQRAVAKMLPDDVGILTLARWNRIKTVREAADRASQVSPTSILASLTNMEARSVLRLCGVETPVVPNTRLRKEIEREFRRLDPATVHGAMVTTLKRTRSAVSLGSLLHNLPKSVKPAAVNLRLKQVERERLVEAMQRPLSSL